MSRMMQIDNAGLTKLILFNYPDIIGKAIILLESLRILPAEIRIWRRAFKRGRFNAAEYMFLMIKYFAIAGFTCDAVVRTSTLLQSDRQCFITHYISYFFILFDTTLVALAIAWRTYIIFQCNKRVYWILSLALAVQLSLSMWSMTKATKANVLQDGYCDSHYPRSHYDVPTMKLALPYYLMYNTFYDLLVTAAATRHLIKSTGASFGFSEISRVLFYNNVHYILVVCTVNFTQAVILYAAPHSIPSLLHISAALQIITAMNLLVIEQDLVHRPATTRVSHAPSSALKSDLSNSSMGKVNLSPSSMTSQSWQTNSKQTSTFQSDSSVGSPLLQSLWKKKSRSGANSAPGITFEQRKMHFYDYHMSDMEKQEYSPTRCQRNGSPRTDQEHNTFIIANPDTPNGPCIYQMSDSIAPSSPTDRFGKESVPFSSATSSRERKEVPMYNASPQQIVTPTKQAVNGVSIRSIRANLESVSVDGGMLTSPLKTVTRPQTSPVTTGPITPLNLAKRSNNRGFEAQAKWDSSNSPTFEISPGTGASSIGTRVKVIPDSKREELLEQMSLRHSASKTSLNSVATKSSVTSQNAPCRSIQRQNSIASTRQYANNHMQGGVDSSSQESLIRNVTSGENITDMTSERRPRPRRLSSLQLDDDPFRS